MHATDPRHDEPQFPLYQELAPWWPLLSRPEDYAEEADRCWQVLERHAARPVRTLLELGSGGGNNACHLASRCALTLVDRAEPMLEQSRRLNPGCAHQLGDLREVRLGRTFDAVLVHDAVTYLTTAAELRRGLATAFAHCAPGGAALFVPDYVRERFEESSECGGSGSPDGRAARYLLWRWDPDPADETYLADFAFLLREPDGQVKARQERHAQGLFPRRRWMELLTEVGFAPRRLTFEASSLGTGLELFVGVRPSQ